MLCHSSDGCLSQAQGAVEALHADGNWYFAAVERNLDDESKEVCWRAGPDVDQLVVKTSKDIKLCYGLSGYDMVGLLRYPYKVRV